MAITVASKEPVCGVPTDAGISGFMKVRLILDGAATSFAVTLVASDPIKTIRGCIGGTSHNIPTAAGVAGTTGFTVKFAAGTNTEFLDLLIWGEGR